MPLAYREPGVQVSEDVSPQVSPLLAAPADVCLVGLSQGYQTRTDQIRLTGTGAIALPGLPVGGTLVGVLAVRDALDPTKGAASVGGSPAYTVTTDYTVSTSNGTVTRVASGVIADNSIVNITYQYIPSDFWQPIRLYSTGAVEDRFGPAYDATGAVIASPLSYAASIAFENGAPSVVCQPLFKRATPGDPTTAQAQPDATQAAAASSWSDTFYALRDIEDINILVPIIGQSMANVGDAAQLAIIQTTQDHIQFMKTNDQYVVGIFGEDSSGASVAAAKATLRTHAATIAGRYGGSLAEQTVLLSPSKFRRATSSYGKQIYIGGQYVAAGIAGMIAARPVSTSLTRKILSGLTEVSDFRSRQDKDDDAAAGLLVIESRRGIIQVRHAVTLDNTSSARRELSVVRAKHRMIESIRDTLDSQVIGNLTADENAPLIVASSVEGVLSSLLQARDIVDYSAPSARLLSIEPTTIEVRFSYRPAFPVNYVDIVFSLDLTTSALTTT